MNTIAMLLGALALLMFGDRLRLINWRTTKCVHVAMYLLMAMWALGVIYDAATVGVQWYQLSGLLGVLIWLYVTAESWRGGAPPATRTDYGELYAETERMER